MFPQRKYLGLLKDGWQDLGQKGYAKVEYAGNGNYLSYYTHHSFCSTKVHVGKDVSSGSIFIFCPKCMVELDNTPHL
jgi:hypothetical protein